MHNPLLYGILPQFLRYYYKWRHLHLTDRRRWSVYPGFSFQVLLLTILDTAATQAIGKRKREDSECDSFEKKRSRILDSDGLMVRFQLAIVKHLSYLFWIPKAGDVELLRELISAGDNSYRIHAASHGGRLVVVKTFEGPRAKQVSTFLCLLLVKRNNSLL